MEPFISDHLAHQKALNDITRMAKSAKTLLSDADKELSQTSKSQGWRKPFEFICRLHDALEPFVLKIRLSKETSKRKYRKDRVIKLSTDMIIPFETDDPAAIGFLAQSISISRRCQIDVKNYVVAILTGHAIARVYQRQNTVRFEDVKEHLMQLVWSSNFVACAAAVAGLRQACIPVDEYVLVGTIHWDDNDEHFFFAAKTFYRKSGKWKIMCRDIDECMPAIDNDEKLLLSIESSNTEKDIFNLADRFKLPDYDFARSEYEKTE